MANEEKNRAIAEILEPKPVWKDGDWVSSRKLWNMHYGVKTAIDFHDDPQAMVALIEAASEQNIHWKEVSGPLPDDPKEERYAVVFVDLNTGQHGLPYQKYEGIGETLMLAVRDAVAKALWVEDGS